MSNSTVRILLTGGSGFLGRQIKAELNLLGHQVYAPRSATFNLETGAGVGELFKKQSDAGKPIEWVIHSAAYYGGLGFCDRDPVGLLTRNLRMITTIFEAAAEARVKKVVSIGSNCAYPGHLGHDIEEEDIFNGRCHPSVEPYGFTKRVQLVFLAAMKRQFGIDGFQIALTNLYGEHDVFGTVRAHAISALMKKIVDAKMATATATAWGTGKPIRQFVYVRDAARAIAQLASFTHEDVGDLVNIGGESISIKDLVNLIASTVGFDTSRIIWDTSRPDGMMRKVVSSAKLERLLPDYRGTPLEDGVRQTIQWYMTNKEAADARE